MKKGRYYRISKKMTEEQRNEVLQELTVLEHVEHADILLDSSRLTVSAQESYFPEIMGKAVNIFRRVAGGAELSFAGFLYED